MAYGIERMSPGIVTAIVPEEYASSSAWIMDWYPEDVPLGELWLVNRANPTYVTDVSIEEEGSGALAVSYIVGKAIARDGTRTAFRTVSDSATGSQVNGAPIGGSGSNVEPEEPKEETSIEDSDTVREGGSLVATITLPRGEWVLSGGVYAFTIASEELQPDTSMVVHGVNREALEGHLYWAMQDGRIRFTTKALPNDDIVIECVLEATSYNANGEGDDYCHGRIDAFPGAGLKSARYRHSLHTDTLPIAIAPQETVNVETPLDFGAAALLMAAPEWTGHSHIVIPRVYENEGTGRMCFTLTNLGVTTARVSEVLIRFLYTGRIAGLITDTEDDAGFDRYITDEDIDLLTEA